MSVFDKNTLKTIETKPTNEINPSTTQSKHRRSKLSDVHKSLQSKTSFNDAISNLKYQELSLKDLVERNKESAIYGDPIYNDYINEGIKKLKKEQQFLIQHNEKYEQIYKELKEKSPKMSLKRKMS